jgi:hypothetical protein
MELQLDLSGNQLCGFDTYDDQGTYNAEGITAIADAMRVNRGLTSIDLSGSQLCGIRTDDEGYQDGTYIAEGITAIAGALRVNGGLTKISLARNELGEEGTKAICEALEQNKTLKKLDISGNMFVSNIGGSAGGKHVAKMLGVNSGLTSIDLSGNQLCGIRTVVDQIDEDEYGPCTRGTYTAEGITAIADALRVNGALTSIELRDNQLGGNGWGAIFAAICGNKDIKILFLDVSREDIGPAGGKLIAEALRTSVTGGRTKIE